MRSNPSFQNQIYPYSFEILFLDSSIHAVMFIKFIHNQKYSEEDHDQNQIHPSRISTIHPLHIYTCTDDMKSSCIIVIRLSYFRPLQLHAKLLDTERQLGELQGRLKEQRQLSGEKIKDREQQVTDLQLKLSRVEEQVKTEYG